MPSSAVLCIAAWGALRRARSAAALAPQASSAARFSSLTSRSAWRGSGGSHAPSLFPWDGTQYAAQPTGRDPVWTSMAPARRAPQDFPQAALDAAVVDVRDEGHAGLGGRLHEVQDGLTLCTV